MDDKPACGRYPNVNMPAVPAFHCLHRSCPPSGRVLPTLLAGLGLALLAGCDGKPAAAPAPPPPARAEPVEPAAPLYTYQVVNTWPHDRAAFTQGLVYLGGNFIETTGLNGSSSLRRVEPQTGRVLQKVGLAAEFFGEGMTVLGDKIFQVTWQNQKGFVYRLDSFAAAGEFSYTGEGWGLTTDGSALILSDGTSDLRFLDPTTFKVTRTVSVTLQGQPLRQLNELEWIKGEIWANLWQTPLVARIEPATGHVLGLIDFTGLLAPADRDANTDVLNGIAYDPATDRIFITGKNWPKLFEVRVVPKK